MSGLPFELLLALRYLRPKRTFVSIITLISVLGVTLGVGVLIIVISVMSGFDKQLQDKIMGFNTHMKIGERNKSLADYEWAMSVVRSNANVRGVTPFVLGQVLVETQPEQGQSLVSAPFVRGVDVELESEVSVLPKSVIFGEFNLAGQGLVVGSDFASNMGISVGDRLSIYSPRELRRMKDARGGTNEIAVLPDEYEVRGIFNVGYYEYDSMVVVTSLENAQDLYDLDDTVHGLMVMLKDPYKAPQVRRELFDHLGREFQITIWTEENSAILNAIAVEKQVMFYILTFIVIVAALCILSAQIVFVVQKTREIGMLKALGATRFQVTALFLSQSAIIGVFGVAIGYGFGMLALAYRNEFLHFMNRSTGFELFPASIYGFAELPALIVGPDIALICGVSFVICMLGGAIPAWQAGRLNPVEALRYE
ncbi:MAG TPA: ABC transporter permease [Verrucomicrobiota bacterium]|nr:ABC transporter permease [Verrucomicrobiota bacterium]